MSHLLLPLLSVCVSVSAGLLGGSIISLTLHHQIHSRLAGALLGAHLLPGHSHASVAYRCDLKWGSEAEGRGQVTGRAWMCHKIGVKLVALKRSGVDA